MKHLGVGQRCVGTLFIWTAAQGGETGSVEGVGHRQCGIFAHLGCNHYDSEVRTRFGLDLLSFNCRSLPQLKVPAILNESRLMMAIQRFHAFPIVYIDPNFGLNGICLKQVPYRLRAISLQRCFQHTIQ